MGEKSDYYLGQAERKKSLGSSDSVQAMVGLTTFVDGIQRGIVVAFDRLNFAALQWVLVKELEFDDSDLEAAIAHNFTIVADREYLADFGDLIGKVHSFVEQSNWRDQVAALLEQKGGA